MPDKNEPFNAYTSAELRAIATRALAEGDEYSRSLLRDQLEDEEFGQQGNGPASDHPPTNSG